jgi:HD-GYP domain-containing protein (c-di-GMP phosphodiesterase class II)
VERRKKPRKEEKKDQVPLSEELPHAEQTYLKALSLTHEFMNDARAGRKVEVDRVKESLNEMIDSVFRNRDAMLSLSKLRKFDEYTFSHCLNVTALVMAVGRHINLNRGQLMDLGLAAMFHDLGKTRIPEAILNKPAKLTDEEFGIMKTHSALGETVLLEQVDRVPSGVLRVVRHHHERVDGSGYPDGLTGDKFRPGMIICAMADVYDALSSDRVYHKGMMPHEALKVVFSLRDKHFPGIWVDKFVQSLGIYPVGTVVRLNNGLIGVVVSVNHSCLTKPKVRGIMNPAGKRLDDPRTYDLTESSLLDWEIKEVIDPKPLGLDPIKALGL